MVALRGEPLDTAEHVANDLPSPSSLRSDDRGTVTRRPVVVLLSAWHPEPVDNGAKQRARMFIQALAGEYTLVLISLVSADQAGSNNLPHVPGVSYQYTVPLPVYRGRSARSLVAGLSLMPRSLASTWDRRTADAIRTIVFRHRARAALAFDLRLMRYLADLAPQCLTILDEPNVSPYVPLPRDLTPACLRGRVRSWKYQRLIGRTSGQIDATIASSLVELDIYLALGGRSAHYLIENAIPSIPEVPWTPPDSAQLLYTGSITYAANADAVTYLADEILPILLSRDLPVEAVVTGNLPDDLSPGPFAPAVRLTGRVADLDEYMRAARLFIAPIREGTGTRIKIIEAMGYGMPVVSTTKGVEGLPVESGVHLIIADDSRSFADACARLLTSPELALQLGRRARALVQSRFTWDIQTQRIEAAITEIIDGSSKGAASHVTTPATLTPAD